AAPDTAAPAGTTAELRREIEEIKRQYQERIDALEKRLADLEARQGTPAASQAVAAAPATPVPGTPTTPPTEAPPPQQEAAATPTPGPETAPAVGGPAGGEATPAAGGGGSQTANYFNPSLSVIGNFLAVGGQNRVENLPNADLRESEVGLQAIVDPYARADFFLSFGQHDVSVEEGFVTFTSLPAQLLAKVGRMRVSFGKINTLHLHVLPWPDEPLPVVNLLGSDGWIGTGVSVARLLPLPGDTFSEATLQILRGEAEGLFTARRRGDLAYNGHYRLFRDLTEATNLDLGLSYALGPNASYGIDSPVDPSTRLEGLDVTLRWKPLTTATYRSATFRGELMRSRREQPGGTQNAVGWFVSGDWQLAKRWFVGGRYESADHADNARLRDYGEAATLTFWPSEFSQLRGELRRRHYGIGYTANEALLQLQFAIGAHGAHPF
ncbi:MAG TPA: hypothetical protein VGR07_11875, partial [Thermoanaerobaculia bacterium]|nr:hypothetical protein [Thermoanaerobaculia bacterium]